MARMDPRAERVVRRTAMVGAVTAAYLLLTADYGPNYPNPVRSSSSSSFGCYISQQHVAMAFKRTLILCSRLIKSTLAGWQCSFPL